MNILLKASIASVLMLATASPVMAQVSPQDPPSAADIDRAVMGASSDQNADPWEGFNRKMFAVHNVLDDVVLVPAARLYRATTPKVGRRGIRRFLANFRSPGILLNDLLQGEWSRAGNTFSRFIVNSTIGAGGFADPAGLMGVPGHNEDFGQTLAVWGVPSGPYLFLPLLGPTNIRDGGGIIVQMSLDPVVYIRTDAANLARISRAIAGGVSVREPLIEPLKEIEAKSLDYYASFRSFYTQARQREILNGRSDFSQLPDIGEFDEIE